MDGEKNLNNSLSNSLNFEMSNWNVNTLNMFAVKLTFVIRTENKELFGHRDGRKIKTYLKNCNKILPFYNNIKNNDLFSKPSLFENLP